MWTEVIAYEEATSTNDLARDHAARGAPEGSAVIAAWQAEGRGRMGRRWFAGPGKSLLASFILRPPAQVARSAWLTLAGGLAVADAVRDLTELDPGLKWPNDVYVGGRKLAGVLAEIYRSGGEPVCVLGIGVNVNETVEDLPDEIRDTATSLLIQSGREWRIDELFCAVRKALRAGYERLLAEDQESLRQRWHEHDLTLGRQVVVETPEGEFRGKAAALDEYGALWVEDVNGAPRKVVVGDVTIRFDD